MITEQDFTILETIHSSDKSRVFLAEAEQLGKKVLVKAIRDAEANVNSVIALQNEFSITQELDNSLKPHGLTYMDSSVAFVRDYLEGITLEKWMKHNPLTNAEAFELRLRLAIQIAQEIELLHNRRMIHKDINPSNIIVSEESGTVFIIDYELSSKLDIKAHFLGNPERLEGTLPYISPEQTGRMNRIIDYRCDLYSFGVVLYELFTGRKPFVFSGVNSALEYIHAHIARTPIEPFKIQPAKIQPATIADSFGQSGATLAVPKVLSNIIMKLLAKNAEDRYQSAFRLRKDVEECLRRYLSEGTISDFPVAISDIPLKFQIPQRLYGRTDERARLMESFASAASGRKMLMLVSGYSGAGKTALVYDIHIPVTERNALFIDGKFEQFQKNIPFLAWTKAFTALTELLLTENQDIIRQWKTRILAAMGDLASVITQLVPALENIIGKQPPPPIIPNNETQNRFHYALRVFIKAICTKERPLVIFIDDLQWADAASLNLLKIMMTEPGLGHLLVITAYRDNEVNTAHPFMRTVDDIQKEWLVLNALDTTEAHAPDNILVAKIALENLSEYHINQLLADTLLQSREQIAPLARLVHTKTNGNAFFVHRFIESLYEKSLIELVTVENEPQWHFSYQAIEERTSATENVIDLLSQKIVQLPENVQKLLSKAAVLGHTFSVKMLSVLLDASVTDTEVDLWNALEESLIIPEDPSYRFIKGLGEKDPVLTRFRFAHDRVRQAVYESIQPEDKKGIHKKAALHLLETLDVRQTEQQIFEITNHLNQAFDVVEDRALLCRMNFQAGTRAKLSTAYATAFNYFEQALKSLETDAWEKNYSFCLNLYDQTAEAAFLSGQYEEMERLVQEILTHGLTALDKVKALEIRTNALFTQQKLVESVESGITALELLGVKLPKKPSQLNVILELLKVKQVLKNTSPQEMLHLPQMQDRTELAKMRIMATLAPALFFTNPNLFPIMLFRMTIISAQHGIASSSAYAFGSFGFVLCGVTGEVAKGIEFGELALRLIKEREFNEYQARALFVVRYFIDHWHKKMVTNVLEIKNAYQQSLETGEADFTAFLGNGYVVYLILAGTPLEEAEHELSKQLQYITQNKQFTSLTFNNLYHQFVLCLLGKAENPALIKGKLYDIYTQEAEYLKTNNQSTLANQCYFQMQLSLLMGQIKEGIHFADVGAKSRSSIVGTSISLQMLFIDGLLRYHAVSKGISTQRRKDRAIIKSNIKKLEKIAQTCPADYQHKVLTLQACVLALQGKAEKARSLIMQAREYATENGNLYDQCFIALECYRFLAEFGEAEEATQALEYVLTLLQQWNGSAVIETLKQEAYYNRLLAKQRTNTREKGTLHEAFLRDAHETSNKATTGSMSNETVDIYSIVKGTQVITGELNLKNLIEKMLAVMSENAGAQRGVLILEQEHGQFSVQAVLADDGTILTIEPIHFEQHDGLCVAVINYVLHSGANLVIDNAASDARFMNDAYIKGSGIKSVLCSKIMVKSKIVGILYLENNLVSGAFTPNRIEVLNILGAQAAIAIENARYYSYVEDMNKTLEQKVQLRTQELEQSNQQLVELNNEKNELMGIVAHDLKNPIGAIRSFAELIENKTFTEGDAVDASRQIVQTSNRMLELVKNLLDINRLESGNMNLSVVAIDIATILDAAMWQYLSQAEAKNIRLELSNEATHSVVLADEQALMQVLDNLVSNAVKYSPLGKNIYIRIKSSDKTVRVEIQDEGEGISQEDMKKLFGKFARLSARPTGGEHSTGLGLSIVKKMVEVMNGHVWCESELGKGATFIVELPKHL